VVAIGVRAINIPYPGTWILEYDIKEPYDQNAYFEPETIAQLPGFLRQLNQFL